ncbi:MAG: hypothetical protein A3J29_09760 [Acidobacteria bacterium RIFCSPLOWO2_12_FULL_67_14b]|nr:MAG: hypothetical protein A3J29_09760 [Acidobacteria bacterium RIFCSPLOWO2_12_FULL_67_14b]
MQVAMPTLVIPSLLGEGADLLDPGPLAVALALDQGRDAGDARVLGVVIEGAGGIDGRRVHLGGTETWTAVL